jgi:hypothetical protein
MTVPFASRIRAEVGFCSWQNHQGFPGTGMFIAIKTIFDTFGKVVVGTFPRYYSLRSYVSMLYMYVLNAVILTMRRLCLL